MNTSQDIKMQMVDDNVGNQVRHNAVQMPGILIVENMKGLSVVSEIENQYGNGNVETAPAEGNGNGINGNPIRCYNCQGEGHYASNCTVKPRKWDAAYLQQQLQIALEEESGIQSTQEEFEFMAAADTYEETERVKVNCTSEDTLQQASTSGTQSDNAPVYDSDGSTEGKSSDTQCASNTLDPVSQKLEDENVSLEFQVSKPKGTTKGMRTNTMFTKKSILGKPPSSSYRLKLYSVTPFPKSSVLLEVDKMNALSKPVTSNSAPSIRESKVVVNNTAKTRRPHPRSNSNTDRVPSKSKSSCLSNNVEKIEENHRNSQIPKNQKHMSSECNNITLAIRNAKSEIVCVMCKQCLVTANHDVCVLNYVNDMNSRADNQSANVSIRENQKKHKANAKNSKELWSKGSLSCFLGLANLELYLGGCPIWKNLYHVWKINCIVVTPENKSKIITLCGGQLQVLLIPQKLQAKGQWLVIKCQIATRSSNKRKICIYNEFKLKGGSFQCVTLQCALPSKEEKSSRFQNS
ncbi:glycine-rich RNA-binding protein 4, mitochondrial [Tanacetum coccineum]|uniref:Glycine-rich RNA-binding protein 4, mitochondrial n=1 Tax=Tanacetum coccineum TaxID=301880 RepID=A0ABQ5HA43_9ASTR